MIELILKNIERHLAHLAGDTVTDTTNRLDQIIEELGRIAELLDSIDVATYRIAELLDLDPDGYLASGFNRRRAARREAMMVFEQDEPPGES